jgi:hypothetical protein
MLKEFRHQQEVREARRRAGLNGGRPKHTESNWLTNGKANGKQKETSPNPNLNTTSPDGEVTPCSSDDERVFSLQPPSKVLKPKDRITLWFERDFWPLYPRKRAKKPALAAALKVLPGKIPAEIIAALRAQLPQFHALIAAGNIKAVPHGATWLNENRWTDEPEVITQPVADKNQRRRDEVGMGMEIMDQILRRQA